MGTLNKLEMRVIQVDDPWFTHLVEGRKTVEGRRALPKGSDLSPGKKIRFKCSHREAIFEIKRVTLYNSLEQYLISEGLRNTLPGVETLEEGLKIYNDWPHECIGIEVRFLYRGESLLSLLGALALSIRLNWDIWYDLLERYELMKRLTKELGREDLLNWLEENEEKVSSNGRIFRDQWPGPYGKCTRDDLKALGLSPEIFTFPDDCIEE